MTHFEDNMLEIFNIPTDLKHDHSEEALALIMKGIEKINILLADQHEACINHVVKYAELNIRFLFLANLIPDKRPFTEALDLFMGNLQSLFKVPKNDNQTTTAI
jgi:hypothetical protein